MRNLLELSPAERLGKYRSLQANLLRSWATALILSFLAFTAYKDLILAVMAMSASSGADIDASARPVVGCILLASYLWAVCAVGLFFRFVHECHTPPYSD